MNQDGLPARSLFAPSGSRCIDLGAFVLRLPPSVSAHDSAYVVDLLHAILPSMMEIVGPPYGLDTLTVSVDNTGVEYFACGINHIVMSPIGHPELGDADRDGRLNEDPFDGRDNDGDGRIDEDLATSPLWDNLFIHELTHAFQAGFVCGPYPSWLIEGMAEAARCLVAERVAASAGREVRYRDFARRIASVDMIDQAGAQCLGGNGQVGSRADFDLGYYASAGAVLIPLLAEVAAGRNRPHPLARLGEELARESEQALTASEYRAIDRAWTTPVDGVFPPSRWMRGRAISCRSVRPGFFVAILPGSEDTAANPAIVQKLVFYRDLYQDYQGRYARSELRLTDADGESHLVQGTTYVALPALPAGAYLCRTEVADSLGHPVHARNWILVTPSGQDPRDGRSGIGVVFVGPDDLPVRVPDLSVDGRILEEVPGGAIIAPLSGLSPGGTITLRSGGSVFATITLPGTFSRTVPIRVGAPWTDPVVSWNPYHPIAGDSVTIYLHPAASSLATADGPVEARLREPAVWPPLQASLMRAASEPGLLQVRFRLPAGLEQLSLEFTDGTSWHRDDGFIIRGPDEPELVSLVRDGGVFRAEFDERVDPSRYALQAAGAQEGPWRAVEAPAEQPPDAPTVLQWSTRSDQFAPVWFRLVRLGAADPQVLGTVAAGATALGTFARAMHPFPNPSPDGVRWPLEFEGAITLQFEVWDVLGRRVSGPTSFPMRPGRQELRWNGRVDGRPLAAGVYWLRAHGPGVLLSSRVVLLPKRTTGS